MQPLRCTLAALALLAAASMNDAYAQTPPASPSAPSLEERLAERERVIADLLQQLRQVEALPAEQQKGVATAKAMALQSYYNSQISYNQNGDRLREHQQRVFAWQITAANFLLAIVVLVSFAGVLFAGYEMVATRRIISSNVTPAAAGTPAPGSGATTIVIEPTKIHVTSAVIGIVILALSLAFLFLFLREVYEIDVLEITDTGAVKLVSTGTPEPESGATLQGEQAKQKPGN